MLSKEFVFILILVFSLFSFGQNCPDDINNSPGNPPQTITADVYDENGVIQQTITCDATGNSNQIDCDLASYGFPPDYYILIEFTNGGNTTTCVYDANGELMPNNPLPVDLFSFTGKSQDGMHLLEWKTASEVDNSHFILKKSDDLKDWRIVDSVSGSGNTSEISRYKSTHSPNYLGTVYYKLEQFDINGNMTDLGVLSLETVGVEIINSRERINIISERKITSLSCYDLNGRKIIDQTINHDEKISIHTDRARGKQILILLVHFEDGSFFRRKLFV